MSMRKSIEVIAQLHSRGVIANYAITGAVAALAYIEPALTQDLDILVSLDGFESRQSGLLLLTPIEQALADMGYSERSDVGVIIESWPVQFIPVASPLDQEALELAADIQFGGEPSFAARVLRAEHVVAKALSLGRLKDLARVEAFLDQSAIDLGALRSVVLRHGLEQAWRNFCVKSGRADILQLG